MKFQKTKITDVDLLEIMVVKGESYEVQKIRLQDGITSKEFQKQMNDWLLEMFGSKETAYLDLRSKKLFVGKRFWERLSEIGSKNAFSDEWTKRNIKVFGEFGEEICFE